MAKTAVSTLLKHSLTVFIPSAALVLAISFFSYQRDVAGIHSDLANQARNALHSAANLTEHSLVQIRRDLLYLANAQSLATALDSGSPGNQSDLIKDWLAFSNAKQVYDQIRWIDETGMEQMRVDYHADRAIAMPSAELQDNGSQHFFIDTMKLKTGEIFVSPFDLDIKGDQSAQPSKPTIRVSTRVFDSKGRPRGIVIVNYLGSDLLQRLRSENCKGLWMTNSAGFWLLGPQPSDEWGYALNKPELTLARRYQSAWARIASQDSADFETAEGFWHFRTVHPLDLAQKSINDEGETIGASSALLPGNAYSWKLIHFQSRGEYDDRLADIDFHYALFLAMIISGLAFGSWLLARFRYAETLALIEAADACQAKNEVEHAHAVAMTERAEQLQIAMETANQASHAKSEFVANMSHEIRTPINAILGLVYLLEQQELTPTMRCMVKQVAVAGKSLLGIINDILDFSKIEAKRIPIEHVPFRLSNVLDNLAGIMSTMLGEKTIEIVLTPLPAGCDELKGDPLRLTQVLTNLTTNAIKFTEQGEVIVAITRLDQAESANHVRLRFSVRDTGVGIPEEKQQLIFEAFSQSDNSTTRPFGGSGLGLTISRHLVRLMGGELLLHSKVGQGSEFYFDLDFEITTHSSMPEMLYQRILVADDNRIARDVLANTAANLGWQVDAVDSGEKAVERVSRELEKPYDVLLIDWRMPGGDGIATAAKIREKYPQQTAPIIVMVTAYDRELLREQPGSEVADILLNKPVTTSSLYNAVAEAKAQRGQLHNINESMRQGNFLLKDTRVLIVDDSEINREVAKQILNHHGAETEVACDGEEALEILKANPEAFDIVLMDVQMPVMDGYTATREIRACPELSHLPVVALTAGAYKVHQLAAFDSGMDEYISKPFEVDELLDVISRLTGKTAGPPLLTDTTPPRPDPASDTSDLINVDEGIRKWGDQPTYQKYLNIFLRDHAEDGSAITDAITHDNLDRALELAHRLRGSAGSMALPRVGRIAADLERALVENLNVSDLAPLLAEALASTVQAILAMVGSTTEATASAKEDQ